MPESIASREARARGAWRPAQRIWRVTVAVILLGWSLSVALLANLGGMSESSGQRALLVVSVILPILIALALMRLIADLSRAALLWGGGPAISVSLAATFTFTAAIRSGTDSSAQWSLATLFAVHAVCMLVARHWAVRVDAAPSDVRAKGSEALRLLSVPLVLGVLLSVLPDALSDEFFVPWLSVLLVGSLVIVLGSGYTSAMVANEEWQRLTAAHHPPEVTDSPASPESSSGTLLGGVACALLVGIRWWSRRRSIP